MKKNIVNHSYDFKKVVEALGLSEKETREILTNKRLVKVNEKFERVTDEDSMVCFRKNPRKRKGGKPDITPIYDLNKDQLPSGMINDFRPLNSFKSIEKRKGEYFLLCLCDS